MKFLTLPIGLYLSSLLLLLIFDCETCLAQFVSFETCPAAGASACASRIAYLTNGNQSLADIAERFTVNVVDIIAANNVDLSEPNVMSKKVPVGLLLIPFECECISSMRRTNTTIYNVQPGNTLSEISDVFYEHLVTYEEIGAVNNITNLDQIQVNQTLVIPFPCACNNNTFKGAPAVFATYVIQAGQELSSVAEDFGWTSEELATLNEIANVSAIQAGKLVMVPIAACASSFDSRAEDFGVLVTSGSYSLSPREGCVQSSCYGSPSLELHSTPSPFLRSASARCPNLQCSNLTIGNFTTSVVSGRCTVTSCLYAGYVNSSTILKSLQVTNETTCPVETAAPPERPIESLPSQPSPPASPGSPPTVGAPTPSSPQDKSSAFAGLASEAFLSIVFGLSLSFSIVLFQLFTRL